MKNWDNLVLKLAKYDRARGLKEHTVKNRERQLFRWGIWLKCKSPSINIKNIDIELIHSYIKSKSAFSSKSSVCGLITMMRAMGDLLVEEGLWIQNPLRWITGPKLYNNRKIPKDYKRKDLRAIFEQSFHASTPYFRSLYPAIISIFYSTGIRKSELLQLNLNDWDREKSLLKIYGSKSSKDRMVPVPETAWKCLEDYISSRNNLLIKLNLTNEALFINKKGSRVNGTQILVQFKRLAKNAGVDKATIHMFRHSCATGLIEEGVPLPHVQQLLGHSCATTTFRYLNIADPERVKAIRKHPITEILNKIKEDGYDL